MGRYFVAVRVIILFLAGMHLLAKCAKNKQNEGTNITDGKIAKQNS